MYDFNTVEYRMTATVTEMVLISDPTMPPVHAELRYRSDDPFAVQLLLSIDQSQIDAFAHATNDHQFIHVDPERAKRVAKRLRRIITVSQNSYDDICRTHDVSPEKLFVVPVGVDPELFAPMPGIDDAPARPLLSRACSWLA